MSKELNYIADLERENRLLGERCNQLLKDKGDLTDQIADIKANCDLAIEGRDIKIKEFEKQVKDLEWQLQEVVKDNDNYQAENKRLEQQIEKMKCCSNCKNEGDYKEPYRYFTGWCNICKRHKVAKGNFDKWEIKEK